MPDPVEIEALRRASGIRLDRDGRWWFRDEPVANERVAALFDRGLRLNPAGEAELHVGDEWCYVDVDETAYVVRRVRDLPDGRVRLVLNDGTEEDLDPTSLSAFGTHDLYCRVKGQGALARFLRDAYHGMVPHLVPGKDGGIAVQQGGQKFPVVTREARPPGARATKAEPDGRDADA